MLTEKETWGVMADAFKNHTPPILGIVYGNIRDVEFLAAGLCEAIGILVNCERITIETYNSILGKIKNESRICNILSGFIWPISVYGARKRVEFCEKMIKELP